MILFLLLIAVVVMFGICWLTSETFISTTGAIEKAYKEMRDLEEQARNCIVNGINTRKNRIRHERIRNRIIALENHINRLRTKK